jgi:4-hydroxymandelate oxidase
MASFSRKEISSGLTRRSALRRLAAFLAGSPLLPAQQDPFRDHSRLPAMDELLTALDFEPVAFAKLARDAYNYMALGVEGEFTLRRNRQAFEWVELVPKGVASAGNVQTATEVLGTRMPFPIMIAPTATQGQLHPQGEMAMHQAATAASQTPMIISINATFPIERIVEAAAGPVWYQLYARPTLDENRELVERAQAAGCRAITITVDQPVGSYRERLLHDRRLSESAGPGGSRPTATRTRQVQAPANAPYRATGGQPWLEWKLIEAIRPFVKVPLLVKGIVTAEDARAGVGHGLDGIVVSNHGGRAMDYAPSTLEALPEVVDAVQGRLPVLIDGGFRRGADVLKALALGAKAVGLGRVPRWGLAAYGPAGVQRVLEIVQSELVLAMAATGCRTLATVDPSLVRTHF